MEGLDLVRRLAVRAEVEASVDRALEVREHVEAAGGRRAEVEDLELELERIRDRPALGRLRPDPVMPGM